MLEKTATTNNCDIVRLFGIPTLRVTKKLGLRLATPIGDPLHPYPDQLHPTLAVDSRIEDMAQAAKSQKVDVLRLRYLPQRTVSDPKMLPQKTRKIFHETRVADLNSNDKPIDIASLVRKRSKWIQLQRDIGTISFKEVKETEERKEMIEEIIKWKREWFAENRINAKGFNDPFHIQCLRNCSSSSYAKLVRIHALYAGEKPIAAEICIASNSSILNIIIAGMPKLRRFGPGILLSRLSLNHAAVNAFETVDFLPPFSPHKQTIAKRTMKKVELRIPLTIKGTLVLLSIDIVTSIKFRFGQNFS